MGVYIVYFSFLAFVAILIIVSTYFISSLSKNRISTRKSERIAFKTKEIMDRHLQLLNLEDIPNDEIEYLKKTVLNKVGLNTFYIGYLDYVKDYGYDEKIRVYVQLIISYKTLLENKLVRNKYRQSYVLYLLSQFQINTSEVEEFALSALGKESIHARNNALLVMQKSGNIPLVLSALEKISNSKVYFNNKVLVDFLDNFKGDVNLLDKAILVDIDSYNIKLQKAIIEHFTNLQSKESYIRDKVLQYISDSNDKELIITATKYFEVIKDPRATNFILENMNSEYWEVRSISAKAIAKYENVLIKGKLEKTLSDSNYLVRYNSAFSLIDLEDDIDAFTEVLDGKDQFAKETMLYAMQVNGLIDFDKSNELIGNYKVEVEV